MVLWLYRDMDKYELPRAVAGSCQELARLCKVKPQTISQAIAHYRQNGWKCPYMKIEIEEDDYESN